MRRQAYSVKEVAKMLGVSERTVWRAIKKGDIKSFRVGSSKRAPVRISAIELVRLLGGK